MGNTAIQRQTTAILIANPASGNYTQYERQIEEAITFLQRNGWQAELCLTQMAGEAGELTRAAVARHIDVVVAIGGDGTINEIIQELAGSDTALGILPSGTINVWAREVGIPLDNAGALEVLLHGQARRVDLGKISGHTDSPHGKVLTQRYFLLMAGIGFDGEVTYAVEKKPVKRFGVLGYLLIGTWLGLGYPAFRAILAIENHWIRTSALQIIVGNTQLYAGAVKYTWQARCDDGLLDICIIRKQSMPGRIMVMMDFLLNHKHRIRWIHYERGRSVTLRTRHPVAIQVDGDPAGYTRAGIPITFNIVPGALKAIIPQQTMEGPFSTTL